MRQYSSSSLKGVNLNKQSKQRKQENRPKKQNENNTIEEGDIAKELGNEETYEDLEGRLYQNVPTILITPSDDENTLPDVEIIQENKIITRNEGFPLNPVIYVKPIFEESDSE